MHNFNIVRLGPGHIEKSLDWDNQEKIDTLVPDLPNLNFLKALT